MTKKQTGGAEAPETKSDAKRYGKVIQVIGPVLDVEFDAEAALPEIYNALTIDEGDGDAQDLPGRRGAAAPRPQPGARRRACPRPTASCAGRRS